MGYGTTIYEKSESGDYHVIANILLYSACAIFGSVQSNACVS